MGAIPSLMDDYRRFCHDHHFLENVQQKAVIAAVSPIVEKINHTNFFCSLFKRGRVPSIYIWGRVGRGKSVLTDLVFAHILHRKKRRLHFHDFMKEVHSCLQQNSHVQNPIKAVARAFDDRYLFLDEFYVSDIADAMILGSLLKAIHQQGVFVIITSNFEPTQLYHDGWQRDRFLDAIDWIEKNYLVLSMDHGDDYRKLNPAIREQRFFSPHTDLVTALFERYFPMKERDGHLTVAQRFIHYHRCGEKNIWFYYKDICETSRSVQDYLQLCDLYQLFLVSHIPILTKDTLSSVRRFTWFIDALYDRRKRLLISSEQPLTAWAYDGLFADQFERTKSRLFEMQTDSYWDATGC